MNSVKEYKEAIQLGVRIRATIDYAKRDTLVVTGEVVKVQGKEYAVRYDNEKPKTTSNDRFWLSFPLVRDAAFTGNGVILYSTFDRKGQRISTTHVEILRRQQ